MSLFKNFFSKNKGNDDSDKKELILQNIDTAISQSKEEIKKSENEIEQIKKWIAEVIHDNFHVPDDFWYEELAHFIEIKEHKENQSVEKEVIHKSDKLIKEYRSQIKFRETKIELNVMTIAKYEESKHKILNLELSENADDDIPKKQDTFQKHKDRLNELLQNPDNYNYDHNPQKQLENIVENVNELIENHEIDVEVKSFMHKLNTQFKAEMKNYDQIRLINEMEKLIEQYKKKQ